MSELKVYRIAGIEFDSQFYHKSEADAILSEKDKTIADAVKIMKEQEHEIAEKDKNLRHSNYKRCEALASNCRLRARWFGDNAFYKKEQWALQWHRRWLELAQMFKEG